MTSNSGAAPQIDVLLEGYGLGTNVGIVGFCATLLLTGVDSQGSVKRILVDPAHVGRRTVLWDALADRGLRPDDIDMVVLTHAHWDHVQNIDIFEHAPVLIHPDEREYASTPHRNDWATPAWTGSILKRQRLEDVRDGDEIIPGVGIIDMAGHTAGSIGITVQNQDGMSIITGDALHYAGVAVSRQNPVIFWDVEQAAESIDRVVKLADVIYPGHDRPFRLTKDNEVEYTRPFTLTLKAVAADTPGLSFDTGPRAPWVMPGLEDLALAKEAFSARRGGPDLAGRGSVGRDEMISKEL